MSTRTRIGGSLGIIVLVVLSMILSRNPPVHAQDTCGPLDVVFLIDDTSSMAGAINNAKNEAANLVNQIVAAAGGDYQMGLVSFKDNIVVHNDLAPGNADAIRSGILGLVAIGGNATPEASDEALNTAINRLPATGRPQTGDFNGSWRPSATKVAILITDAPPGGFDDACTPGVDDVNAHSRAVEAANAEIKISSVFVPHAGEAAAVNDETLVAEPLSCNARAVMQDYAATSSGVYTETSPDGSGTANAIQDIIASCGSPTPTPIPEPTTIVLLGSGVAALGAYLRKRRYSTNEQSVA